MFLFQETKKDVAGHELSQLPQKKNLLSENDSEKKKNQNLILNLSMTLDKRLLSLPRGYEFKMKPLSSLL